MSTYDFLSAETTDDPFPLFDRLRENDPLFETDFGYWYVSRYDDVVTLLRDARLTSGQGVPDSLGVTEDPLRSIMDSWMMALDGEAHTRARRMISRAFTPRAVEGMRAMITALAEKLVDGLVKRGGGDIIDSLAFPLPMDVTRVLFGVDTATWDSEVVALFDPKRLAAGGGFVESMEALTAFLADFIPKRQAAPGADLFSALSSPDENGDRLSDHEQVANAVLLVTAGFETTMSLIVLSVRDLLMHPDQLGLLRQDWSLSRNAVEEVLRYDPAALWTSRFATVDIDVAGGTIPAGSNVLFSSLAANRDPARYTDPHRFDITRPDIRPVTFGGGVHNCIGAALARLEAEVAISTLFQRAPGISAVTTDVVWQTDNPSVRRPIAFEVRV